MPALYEQAAIKKGFHLTEGLSVTDGNTSIMETMDDFYPARFWALGVQLYTYYGFSRHCALFFQGSADLGRYQNLYWANNYWHKYTNADVSLGVKVSPVDKFAAKINTGLPSLIDLTLLWDVHKNITLSLISRSVYYLGAGADLHTSFRENGPQVHFFVGGNYYLGNPVYYDYYTPRFNIYYAHVRVGLGLEN